MTFDDVASTIHMSPHLQRGGGGPQRHLTGGPLKATLDRDQSTTYFQGQCSFIQTSGGGGE
jgi:hypothetical protein